MKRNQGRQSDPQTPVTRIRPVPLLSDRPEEDARHFQFEALRNAMVGMLARAGNPAPFVFLFDGRWGTGKTTLMRSVIRALRPAVPKELFDRREEAFEDWEGWDRSRCQAFAVSSFRHAPVAVLEQVAMGKKLVERQCPYFGDENSPEGKPGEDLGISSIRSLRDHITWFADATGGLDENAFWKDYRPVRCVFFNAWKYRNEAEIFPALAHQLLREMRADGWLARFQAVVQELANVDWQHVIARMGEAVPYAGGALGEVLDRPAWLRDLALYDRARPYMQALVTAWCTTYDLQAGSVPRHVKDMLTDDIRNAWSHLRRLRSVGQEPKVSLPGIVAVFIDDLDRCPKEHVNEVLKSLNLLVDLESCVFVLGADRERVAQAVREAHNAADDAAYGLEFLSKIVQLDLTIPQPRPDDVEVFIREVLIPQLGGPDSVEWLEPNLDLLKNCLPPNPREIKRFLNGALLQKYLLGDGERDAEQLLKFALAVFLLPRDLGQNAAFIERLQELAREMPSGEETKEGSGAFQAAAAAISLVDLAPGLLERVDPSTWERLRTILARGEPFTRDELQRYSAYAAQMQRSIESEEPEREDEAAAEKKLEAEQKKRRIRAREVRELRPLIEEVIEGLLGGGSAEEAMAAMAPYRDFARAGGKSWSDAHADVIRGAIEGRIRKVGDEDLAKALADGAQTVLTQALSDRALASDAAAMNLALALRDGAVDRVGDLEGGDPTEVDPFQKDVWQEEETRVIESQLEALRERLAGASDLQELFERHGFSADSELEDLLIALFDRQEKALAGDENAVWPVKHQGGVVAVHRGRSKDPSWLLVPPGPFIAGDVVEDDERPVRIERTVDPVWVARDPVTVGEFLEFMRDQDPKSSGREDADLQYNLGKGLWKSLQDARRALGGRSAPEGWAKQVKYLERPVVGICWFEAAAYCLWKNGVKGTVKGWGGPYRLPTEAEWEKAARGLFGRRWPWGCAWRPELAIHGLEPLLENLAPAQENKNLSPLGVRGTAGNVWEWTSTSWYPEEFGKEVAPAGVKARERISLRGGSFYGDRRGVRCAFRYWGAAGGGYVYGGFRCFRDVIG